MKEIVRITNSKAEHMRRADLLAQTVDFLVNMLNDVYGAASVGAYFLYICTEKMDTDIILHKGLLCVIFRAVLSKAISLMVYELTSQPETFGIKDRDARYRYHNMVKHRSSLSRHNRSASAYWGARMRLGSFCTL